ncbi:MAG TPA: hypothetical protein VF881_09255, partial [Polyangiaceae bacterium]
MSAGKGADDLQIFDELVKSKSERAEPDPADWSGPVPPPPASLGGLMAPVARLSNRPTPPPPPGARVSGFPQHLQAAPSVVPPPPPSRASSGPPPTSMRPPPPPPRATRKAAPPPPPPPRASVKPPPLPIVQPAYDDPPAPPSNGTLTNAAVEVGNPFLSPIQSLEEGGPPSLLPPAPATSSSMAPNLSRTKPPPSMLRSSQPSVRPLPPPPARATPSFPPVRATSSMVPPPAMAGTVPPYRGSLDSEIAALHSRARRKKIFTMLAFAAVVAAGYFQRDKLLAITATPAAPEMSGIKASAKQGGVKLVVDGKELGMLPQEVKDLTPGVHSLLFEGTDRYAPYKVDVNLGPNEVRELEPVQLKVAKGSAIFDVKTPEATLTLVSGDDRRSLTDTSRPLDIDMSKSWTLEATKAGYKPLTMPLTFTDQAQKTFVVALEENKVAAPETPTKPAAEPPAPEEKTAVK